jgi:hypothetical protein
MLLSNGSANKHVFTATIALQQRKGVYYAVSQSDNEELVGELVRELLLFSCCELLLLEAGS